MDKKNLMPHQAQPVNRVTTGQLPSELTELSGEFLLERYMEDSYALNILSQGIDEFKIGTPYNAEVLFW